MEERLAQLLEVLKSRREVLLQEYLTALEQKDWTNEVSMQAINTAGRVHDIDRHITNIHLELKRLETELAHAS